MQKDDLNKHVFQNRNWCSPKSDRLFFFEVLLSEDLSIGSILSEKKYRGTGLISKKKEIVGKFPDWAVPQLILPRGQIPHWHFPDGHFPDWTIFRLDTSPTEASPAGHFPTNTFSRPDISPTITYFQIFAFFSEPFC